MSFGLFTYFKELIAKEVIGQGFTELAANRAPITAFLTSELHSFINPVNIPLLAGKDEQEVKDNLAILITVIVNALFDWLLATGQDMVLKFLNKLT